MEGLVNVLDGGAFAIGSHRWVNGSLSTSDAKIGLASRSPFCLGAIRPDYSDSTRVLGYGNLSRGIQNSPSPGGQIALAFV